MGTNIRVKKVVYSGVFLALALVLPFLTGQLQSIGNMLCPMHIPVLLCGFICGWPYGMAVGFIAPILRSSIWGMPSMYPAAAGMAFELAVYGFMSGVLYARWNRGLVHIYADLIAAMLSGRVVWGIVRYMFAGISGGSFGLGVFLAGAFTNAIPGIICQLVLIPAIVSAFRRARLTLNDNN